ncbi:NAD(P)-dependent oxidoreductase [Altererythrobacter sp. MF3-039]|uniref:precorrin-2 dehydrogenase/sirohydrochlorin ferrochelatase family protein n=1 Tax=Altererythrobacter sp. MF3-039 TaxID=3252901 RepID=UPI00390C515C
MRSLPLFHRIAGQRVVLVGDGAMAEAKQRLIERAGGTRCSEAEAHHAKLAFVALEDEREAQAAARRLKAKGLLVNVADMPDLCDFTLPSILERDPVLVAISTSGASAGLAKHLRLRLEALLPQTIGRLTQGLSDARDRLRETFTNGDDRRRALDEALGEGGALDVLDGASAERLNDWLKGNREVARSRTIDIVLDSDDPEDLTLRHARLLGMADVVMHDPGVPEPILIRARADALRRPLTEEQTPIEGLVVILRRS